jgi:signal transduction histidine kinase
LLENLLEWSILRRGTTVYQPEEASLNRIVDRSIAPVLESARRKNITLNLELDRPYSVNCDLRMTETVFRNLISNALKYTYPNGKVEISARSVSNGDIEVSVKDTGIGMSKDLISRLFIVNEQVSRKGTDGESSSGLGLLICKEFVELQGGKIWAESEEGNGSTFYFTLKLIK